MTGNSKSRGSKICCFFGCSVTPSHEPKRSFHKFPHPTHDKKRYKKWVKAVKHYRKSWEGPKHGTSRWHSTVVCSDHFEDRFLTKRSKSTFLSKSAVPTIYHRSHSSINPARRTSNSQRSDTPQVCLF